MVMSGTSPNHAHFVDTKVGVFAYCHCLINYVLIKYAITKDMFAQYSCTLNVLVVLIEYHLYLYTSSLNKTLQMSDVKANLLTYCEVHIV